MVQDFLSTERDFTGFYNPEGPYILPLWNQVPKEHPHHGLGDLIPS